jgi:translation initiation factor IF-3
MAYNNPRYNKTPKVRTNEGIRAREVRVIGSNNAQMGVMDTLEAVRMARNEGLDLIEIAPNATPPVCRIMDFGKYRYEHVQKEKDQNKSKTPPSSRKSNSACASTKTII